MALFFIFILISIVQEDVSQPILEVPPTPEYWEGVSLSRMGFELIPYCDPVQVSDGPEQKFVQLTGKQMNTIHGNDYSFYEELNATVQ